METLPKVYTEHISIEHRFTKTKIITSTNQSKGNSSWCQRERKVKTGKGRENACEKVSFWFWLVERIHEFGWTNHKNDCFPITRTTLYTQLKGISGTKKQLYFHGCHKTSFYVNSKADFLQSFPCLSLRNHDKNSYTWNLWGFTLFFSCTERADWLG